MSLLSSSSSFSARRSRLTQREQRARSSTTAHRPPLPPFARARPPSAIPGSIRSITRSTTIRCRATPADVNGSGNDPEQQNQNQNQNQTPSAALADEADTIVEREIRGVFSGSNVRVAADELSYVFRDVAAAEVYAFDVEAVAGPQLAEATRACAVRAARAVFGEQRVPGGDESAYRAALDATLPAVVFPYEAAILARLLVDEGLVDFGEFDEDEEEEEEEAVTATAAAAAATTTAAASSASKRRRTRAPPPPSTTRPLLPAEIVEHWDEVRATCLQRWARERDGGGEAGASPSPSDVDEALRAAFLEAQLTYEFSEEDEGASSSSSSSSSDTESSFTPSRIARFGPRRAAAAAAATASAAAASATLARAVSEAPDLVYVLCAGHARRVAAAALSRAGVGSGAGNRRGRAVSAARRCVPVYAPSLEAAAEKALDLQDARDRVRFVFDRPSRAERVKAHLDEVVSREQQARATVHVAEGVCAAASHRAAAAASGALLSEREVLEGLGVADSPAVMDGVEWR
jgi:hypothetical protein